MIQQQAEGNCHVATTQVGPCPLPETNTTFYIDVLPIVTAKQRLLVSAVYGRIGKWPPGTGDSIQGRGPDSE